MSRDQKVFWLALAVKAAVAAALPLTNDESYYWVWSLHPQLSYFDHPPAVAWLFKLGQFTDFGPGGARLPGVALAHATLGVWLKILARYLAPAQLRAWFGLALLSPLMGGSGLIVTPDVPLMFFYALAFGRWLRFCENAGRGRALALGLCGGLGFSSKYMMVLFGLSLGPTLWARPGARRSVYKYCLFIAAGFVAGAAPVWAWNLAHGWASFRFQAAHGLGAPAWKPSWTYEYALAQIGIVFPAVAYWAWRGRRALPGEFALMAAVPPLFFLATTARGYVEANWPLVAYPAIFALAAARYPINKKYIQGTLALWAVALAGALGVVVFEPGFARAAKFKEFHEYDGAAEAARALPPGVPLYARSYQMAAKLTRELGRPVPKVRGLNRVDFYDFLDESAPTAPRVYAVVEPDDAVAESALAGYRKIGARRVDDRFEIWEMARP